MLNRKLFIAACLALIVAVAIYALRSKPVPVSYEVGSPSDVERRARLEWALEQPVNFHFQQMPLDQALKQIARKTGIAIDLDLALHPDLRDTASIPVTFDVSGITLRSALNQLLDRHALMVVSKGETLLVTTRESYGPNVLTAKVYPVRDLVMLRSKSGVSFNYQQLINVITGTTDLTSWEDVGGSGDIRAIEAAGALVVRQTREVHTQVELLLTTLRKARDAQGIRPGEAIVAGKVK